MHPSTFHASSKLTNQEKTFSNFWNLFQFYFFIRYSTNVPKSCYMWSISLKILFLDDDVMQLFKRRGKDWIDMVDVRQRQCRLETKNPLVEHETQRQIQLANNRMHVMHCRVLFHTICQKSRTDNYHWHTNLYTEHMYNYIKTKVYEQHKFAHIFQEC